MRSPVVYLLGILLAPVFIPVLILKYLLSL